jgi:hypothetical protein
MSRPLVGVLLVVTAVLVHAGFVLPTQRAATDIGDDYRRARQRRREAVERLNRAERLRASRARATAAMAPESNGEGSLLDFRRSVLSSLRGHSVSSVRLSVVSGRPPVFARVTLSAEGSFSDVIGLTGSLVGAGTGLVLDQVRVRPGPLGAAVELEALRLGSGR